MTNPESMWMFGFEGGTSLFYQGVLQLGTGVKVTARRLSLPFPWKEAGYFLVWGPMSYLFRASQASWAMAVHRSLVTTL